jgi:nucleotide-binding universal stress UspA family protein
MKKILCPTDFSDKSLDAYNFASQVALALEADLLLYHASNVPLGASDSLYFKNPKDFPANLQVENKKLIETWQKLKNSEGENGKIIHYDFIVEQGFPLSSIIKAVGRYNADLVIMHTKGSLRDKFEGIYLGSIGAQVVEEVKCNVMLVPPGISHENIKNIVYALNLKEYDLKSVKKVLSYARTLDAHVTFLYLAEHDNGNQMEDFRKKIAYEVESGHVSTLVRISDNYIRELDRSLASMKVDMLVMERHQRTILQKFLHKSLVREMTKNINVPLLIMHVED